MEKLNHTPKTITYKRLRQNKTEDELWRTLFEIEITNPAGNTNSNSLITMPSVFHDAECERGSETTAAEISLGIATTTTKFLLDCTSKERILDNGNLFGIID